MSAHPSNADDGRDDRITDEALADDALEDLLTGVLQQVETVPATALAKAYQASQLRTLNKELAALVYDSEREGDLVLTRGAEGQARLLSFANDHLSLDLTLLPDGVSLVGELSPSDAGALEIEQDDGATVEVAVDEWGRFRATTADGPIRLRIVGRLVTPWITR